MRRIGSKKMLVVALAILALSLYAAPASAGCHHRHACHSCCGGGWGYGYSHGLGYGYNGCCMPISCCGMYAGSSFAYWGSPVISGCGCSGAVLDSAPAGAVHGPTLAPPSAPPATAPVPTPRNPPLPNRTSIESTSGNRGFLTVWVPYDAKVTVNGAPTKSIGSQRQYFCSGLRPGLTYEFEVRAEVVREGKIVSERKTVSLTAGERGHVAFRFNAPRAEGLAAAK